MELTRDEQNPGITAGQRIKNWPKGHEVSAGLSKTAKVSCHDHTLPSSIFHHHILFMVTLCSSSCLIGSRETHPVADLQLCSLPIGERSRNSVQENGGAGDSLEPDDSRHLRMSAHTTTNYRCEDVLSESWGVQTVEGQGMHRIRG